jgi:RNA recognition motif-containing protein
MTRKLYVGNLSEEITEAEIQALFTKVGTVNRVRFAANAETGERRNFAYVEMATQEAADAAIQRMNGHEINERKLKVREARPSGAPKSG